ncbi:hypothetical protein IB238_23870 [Rhizobium sp. ARZ01]|uniref:hypothetical protein n=1 Tax=Rhizobium sp. ARZ01 TaxID=2769313 RepID=UPI001784CCBE|nr:hypothetical protein [Rhizobium sp. ARZ01]MBD9375648.1 hypothetical protein [Rhizobium sp. ARZ01]
MITRFTRAGEFVGPEDLAILQEVFDNLCKEHKFEHRSATADELARQIFEIYKAGARDRERIMTLVQARLQRRVG